MKSLAKNRFNSVAEISAASVQTDALGAAPTKIAKVEAMKRRRTQNGFLPSRRKTPVSALLRQYLLVDGLSLPACEKQRAHRARDK